MKKSTSVNHFTQKRLWLRILTMVLSVSLLISLLPMSITVYAASNEETIYNYLINTMGLNQAAACGVLANIYCESGFNPNVTGDSGTSYGICQWHNNRWTNLKNYCNNNGYDWTTLNGQLHFLEYELKNSYTSVYNTLTSVSNDASGAYNAGYKWCFSFEVPANYSSVSVSRGNLARNTYWPKYSSSSSSTYTYNAEAALAYAAAHWNDGVGLCAEFVSKCVQAGGINISTITTTTECANAICNATGVQMQELTLTSDGYATQALNAGILSAGDVVLQNCKTHSVSPHILLCAGFDSQGYAVYYAHNSAMNGTQRYKLSVNTSYQHTTSCNMCGKVVHLSNSAPVGIPQNIYATQKALNTVGVSWDAAANASYYEVYLIQSPYGWDDIKYSATVSSEYTYAELSGVAEGDYMAFVIARPNDSTAQSDWVPVSVVNTAPAGPTITASSDVVKTGDTLTISWNAVLGATEYEYYMAEYPYAFAYENYLVSDSTKGTSVSFLASNLPNGRYCFFMHAKNAAGWSPQSNWVYFDVYNSDYVPTTVGIYNGHIYAVYDQDLSWTFAEQMCENAGGHLVTITSQEENDYICNLIKNGAKPAYWIGARSDRSGSWYDSDNPFAWVTDEVFDFTNWYPGEPNSSESGGEKEHFAEVRKSYNYQWNDKANTRNNDDGFILEIDSSTWVPTTTMTYGSSKYLLFDIGTTWSEARAYCDYNGGHLATISSSAEDAAISNLLKEGSHAWFYLGGRSVGGTWKWLDDTEIPLSGSYSHWSDTYGAAQTGPTGWGNYLMKYKSFGTWIGISNYYNPAEDINHLGFVMEIDNAVNTATFHPNGGSVETGSKTIVYGEEYGELPVPTYANYVFDGWYTAATGGEKITATSIVSVKTNQTLYAHWTHVCADGHSYSYAVTTAPTTSVAGVLTGTCSKCNGTTTVTLPKLDTTNYTYAVVTAATCTANGIGRYTWKTTTYGTFTFDVSIPKTEHNYVDTVTAPTCTEQGYTTHTCSICGNSYQDSFTAALGHNYVNGVCTRCGAEDPNYIQTDAKFILSEGRGAPGTTVTVELSIEKNPGLVSAYLDLSYDTSKLTLTGVEDTGLLTGALFGNDLTAVPFALNWDDSLATANNNANGVIARLTFQIKDDCPEGSIPISISYTEGNIINKDLNNVPFMIVNGSVEVVNYILGDVDGDGQVLAKDVAVLRRYLAHWAGVTIVEPAADVNKDGKVTAGDVAVLRRYLAHWSGVALSVAPAPQAATRSIPHRGVNDPTITVSSIEGNVGDQITLNVDLLNNPGIVTAYLDMSYDSTKLRLVSVEDTHLLNGALFTNDYAAIPFALNWDDSIASSNNTKNGTIAKLTFEILDGCANEPATVSISYVPGNILNYDLDEVDFAVTAGAVSTSSAAPKVTHSLSLKDEIDVNFYFTLPASCTAANTTVSFAWGEDKTAAGTLAEATGNAAAQGYTRVARCPVPARSMTDTITMIVKQGDTVLLTNEYCIADYCEDAAEHFYNDDLLLNTLCDMLDYGGLVQNEFNYRKDDLAGNRISALINAVNEKRSTAGLEAFDWERAELPTAPIADPDTNVDTANFTGCGIQFYAASLTATAKTAIRLYFTITDATVFAGTEVYLGETKLDFVEKNGKYYVEIPSIDAKNIFDTVTLRFENSTNSLIVKYNAIHYLNAVQASTNTKYDNLKLVMNAMYNYWNSAKSYFQSQS